MLVLPVYMSFTLHWPFDQLGRIYHTYLNTIIHFNFVHDKCQTNLLQEHTYQAT